MAQMKDVRPNAGEGVVWDLFKKNLPDDVICYANRTVESYESDALVLIPDRGLFVIEVKSWYPESVYVDDMKRIFLKGSNEETQDPKKQVKRYRNCIWDFLKKKKGICPLVAGLVCYTNMTQKQWEDCKLSFLSEPENTIFSDDLSDPAALMEKFNQAYIRLFNESLSKMDAQCISVIRSTFEPRYNEEVTPPFTRQPPYSAIYCLQNITNQGEIIARYFFGTKIIIFTSDSAGTQKLIDALSNGYNERGIMRDGSNLKFNAIPGNHFALKNNEFSLFNFSLYLLPEGINEEFLAEDGRVERHDDFLEEMQSKTSFNYEQYKVEHAPLMDIAVKAGAGTGKTYSMVSRIGFLYHTDIAQPEKMSDGIAMLTFTNEAADNMRDRLKKHFMNYYVLTNQPKYLDAIADVELMRISTIHKFANSVIRDSALSLGLGHQFSITNSDFLKRRVYSHYLGKYIQEKNSEDPTFSSNLPIQAYQIVDLLIRISELLYNKGVDVEKIQPSQLGESVPSMPYFNEMIIEVLQKAEQALESESIKNNEMALDHTMVYFRNAIASPSFKADSYSYRYMFVDEFQDTDDTQIEIFALLKKKIGFHMFVVGDLKQSIYRFRGATLDAFNKLKAETGLPTWAQDYDLRINYRTDHRLLAIYDDIFRCIGSRSIGGDGLLPYDDSSTLTSRIQNPRIEDNKVFCFKEFLKSDKNSQFDLLAQMIREQKQGLESIPGYEELSLPMRSIAILVRKNYQVRTVLDELGKRGLSVETKTGGDLYQSAPARDLALLISALCFPHDRHVLYALIDSDNINTDFALQKISDLNMDDQLQGITDCLDQFYMQTLGMNWNVLVTLCHERPVLAVLKNIYDATKPWINGGRSQIEQVEYQNNYDLLIELMLQRYDVESLTIETMREFLTNNILTGFEAQSRKPEIVDTGVHIICLTIHKSKGLEFAYVDMPYTQEVIDCGRSGKTNVMVLDGKIGYAIGMKDLYEHNSFYEEEEENLQTTREEARILYVAMTRAISSFSWMTNDEEDAGLTWSRILRNGGTVDEH